MQSGYLLPRFWSNPLEIPFSVNDSQQGDPLTVGPIDKTMALDDQFTDLLALGLPHPPTPTGKKAQGFGAVEAFLDKAPSGSGRMLAQIIPNRGQIGQGTGRQVPAQTARRLNQPVCRLDQVKRDVIFEPGRLYP